MKLCPYCSKEMEDAANVCAQCGRDWKTGVSHVAPAETVQPRSSSSGDLRKSGATAILVAVAVTLATGFVSFNVLLAAGWSSIHGGLSEGALYVLFFIAVMAPLTLGFLAGAVVRRRLGKRGPTTIGPG